MGAVSIGWIDIAIVILYLVFIIWWGLRHGKSSDAGSYFLAGRTMPWWVVGLSLFAASISSTTLIGQCGDAYHTGIAVFNYNLTGVVVMVFFATFLLPLYIKSKIFTIPDGCFGLAFHNMDPIAATSQRWTDVDRFVNAPLEYVIMFEK